MISSTPATTEYGRKAARNVSWAFAAQCVGAGLTFAWLLIIPRLMGPDYYGSFIVVSSLINVMVTISALGIGAIFARYLPKFQAANDNYKIRELFAGVAGIRGALGLGLGLGAMWIAARLIPVPLSLGVRIAIGAAVALAVVGGSFGALIYGRNQIKKWSVLSPLRMVASIALVSGLFLLSGLEGALAGLALAQVIFCLAALGLSRPWVWLDVRKINVARLWEYLKFGLLASFGGFIYITMARGGNLALAGVGISASEIAMFSISCSLCVQVATLFGAMAKAILPGLSELVAENESARGQRWVKLIAKYQTIAAILVFFTIALNGRELFVGILGSDYAGIWPAMVVALSALPFIALLNLAKQVAIAWGRAHLNFETWLVLTAVFMPLVIFGGKTYGATGAAAAFALTALIAVLYLAVRLSQLLKLSLVDWHTIFSVVVAVPAGALLYYRSGFAQGALLTGLFWAAYLSTMYVIGALNVGEIREAKRALAASSELQKDSAELAGSP